MSIGDVLLEHELFRCKAPYVTGLKPTWKNTKNIVQTDDLFSDCFTSRPYIKKCHLQENKLLAKNVILQIQM